MWDQYTWLFGVSIVLAFFVAWGIGANDVANAFGTSVGAKALTMKQAILVASVCEFGGAMLLGSGVTDTIKSGIADITAYTYQPELLMYGMVCALLSAGLWLLLATYLELPVSTTHSIVGAIVGMSMVAGGADSVIWEKSGDPFPQGVVAIVLAWFITPAMAAVMSALLFTFTKFFVLRAKDPFKRSLILFPFYTFLTIWVVTFFIIQKGVNGWMKNETYTETTDIAVGTPPPYPAPSCPAGGDSSKTPKAKVSGGSVTVSVTGCVIPDSTNAWISAVTAAVVTAISIACLKWVIKLVERDMAAAEADDEAHAARIAGGTANKVEGGGKGSDEESVQETAAHARTPAMLTSMRRSKMWTKLAYSANYDIHDSIADDAKLTAMHNEAEVFDRKTEFSFKYLQVCTACANSFAHGANDVANAVGSMAAVYAIWDCGCANSKAEVPIWMFVIGGAGLVVGLATYGYKIMRALGVKMTKLTNSRGYCAELTAAIIVIVASRYGFPVSTTQVITGAITGIGIQEVISAKLSGKKGAAKRFNWLLLLKFFSGWVATLVVAGLTAALFTAVGIYSPSKFQTHYRIDINDAYNTTNIGMIQLLNSSVVTDPANAAQVQAVATAKLTAVAMKNATKLTWNSNNATMLATNTYTSIFQTGTWAVGNASLAGVLPNNAQVFMPYMPQEDDVGFD